MMRWLFLLALLAWGSAAAADLWVVNTVTSYHSERSKPYNEWNRGLGVEYGGPSARLIVGDYLNSLYRRSAYGGVMWTPVRVGGFRAGLMSGAVSGYQFKEHGGYSPMLLPVITYERAVVGVNLIVVPPIERTPWVVGLQIKVKAW